MGLKYWLTKKLVERQAQQMTSLPNAIDDVLAMKVKKLRKAGKPINKENLMAGWKALKVLGVSQGMIEDKVEVLVKEAND